MDAGTTLLIDKTEFVTLANALDISVIAFPPPAAPTTRTAS
jgi:hypothetical protein